jgi:hypothetical protein
LLDWSENLGTALYFALFSKDNSTPTIWILNPYELNKLSYNSESLFNPITLEKFDYSEAYLSDKTDQIIDVKGLLYGQKFRPEMNNTPFEHPVSIVFPLGSDRLFAQKGLFTLQGSDATPIDLNKTVNSSITKFELPREALPDAYNFLKLSGINEFSIYPDLDGLARYLKILNGIKED